MINRIIIRIKLLQIVYSYYLKESKDLELTEKELMFSLQKSYDLYRYFLLLIAALTDAGQKRQDLRKHRYLATSEEKHPNTRFVNNRFAEQLRQNQELQQFENEKGSIWIQDDSNLIKNLLEQILDTDIYHKYLDSEDDYRSDREFWRKLFKDFISKQALLFDFLEEKSIYWNDDVDIICSFVLKTIKQFDETDGRDKKLLPMFKNEHDREFAVQLLNQTILHREEYSQWIDKYIRNWDLERIATIDLYIMQIAIAELLAFPSIPISVTLNEYIDIAKFYSTPKSGLFINGILDTIVQDLKKENKLFKN